MFRSFLTAIAVLASAWLLAIPLAAQSSPVLISWQQDLSEATDPMALPDAPTPSEAAPGAAYYSDSSSITKKKTSEILAGDPYQPLSKHQKWEHFLHRTYSSATFLGVAEDTVFTRATGGGFMYCCGAGAWGEAYAATLADGESRELFGNFLFPTLLRQDPRYFPKRTGSVLSRAWYAATRVVVTRNDSGREMFNFSEVMGVAFSKALSNAYYPNRYCGGWDTTANILGTFQSDATSNLLREFWPDIRNIVHKHTPQRFQSLEERMTVNGPSRQF